MKKDLKLNKAPKNKSAKKEIKIEIVEKSIKKIHKIIFVILAFFVLLGASYYSYVIGAFDRTVSIKSHTLLTKNFFSNSNLKDNLVVYKSESDLSNYKLISKKCNIETKFVSKLQDFYVFYFKILDKKCDNPLLHLEKEKDIVLSSYFDLNIIDDFSIINKFTDYKTDDLKVEKLKLVSKINELNAFSGTTASGTTNIDFLQKNRQLKETIYIKDKINYVLEGRRQTYLIPVLGYNLPKKGAKGSLSIIPGAGRPYRADTTDGIHHGWDVLAPLYTPVRSLADGIIIRVIKDFKFDDLKKIKTGSGLSFDDKMKNLDILRGNQIWLKTMKGDVVFYAHLSSINDDIKPGMIIESGKTMGKIGITGVPDKNYTNYHLHFEIAQNPKLKEKIGDYNFDDMINWDYVGKGMGSTKIFAMQDKMFKK
ncbi:MAG: M23 family metallopeptidase [Candidatus Gracilibacteria bacterium]|nr:M23 family metallopeptidase [Candidatus Gracilibacteria bacterium]